MVSGQKTTLKVFVTNYITHTYSYGAKTLRMCVLTRRLVEYDSTTGTGHIRRT